MFLYGECRCFYLETFLYGECRCFYLETFLYRECRCFCLDTFLYRECRCFYLETFLYGECRYFYLEMFLYGECRCFLPCHILSLLLHCMCVMLWTTVQILINNINRSACLCCCSDGVSGVVTVHLAHFPLQQDSSCCKSFT